MLVDVVSPRAVWLYGSVARGDADELSDVDVLVVGDSASLTEEERASLPSNGPLSLSHYTWGEFEAMALYGSLFLHHLRSEGKPLSHVGEGRNRIGQLLDALPRYMFAGRDLVAFERTVDDVRRGLEVGTPPAFELAVLGGVVRHASVLACYLAGHPTFGRGAIRRACRYLSLSTDASGFETLYLFRVHEFGRCALPHQPSLAEAHGWVERMREYLAALRSHYAHEV